MNEKEKMLNLMKFWLFGTFAIIFAASTVYIGGAIGTGLLILRERNYWIAMIVTGVLCIVWYYIYKWYLYRQD